MGRGRPPLAGEGIGADASDGHQHAYCVDEGARLAEEVAGEEDHDEPADRVEHRVRRHLVGSGLGLAVVTYTAKGGGIGGFGPAPERRPAASRLRHIRGEGSRLGPRGSPSASA